MNLEKVYFKAKDENEARVIVALLSSKGRRGWDESTYGGSYPKTIYTPCHDGSIQNFGTSTPPSRTLATTADLFASALVGFKNAWEVAPDGMKFATKEQRKEFSYPTDCDVMWCSVKYPWQESGSAEGWRETEHKCEMTFAVPADYVFEKPVKKMTVAEIAEKLGYDVEIVK